MFEAIFGNTTIERILIYLLINGEGYPSQLADRFNIALNGIQQQLQRLEDGGIIVSDRIGKTRVYRFNLAYPLMPALRELLRQAVRQMELDELRNYYRNNDETQTHSFGVRALIVQNGYILVASERGTTNTFLPGGYVDPGIGIEESLRERLKEQFRGKIVKPRFIGVLESPLEKGDESGYRTDMVYAVDLSNYSHPERPKGLDIYFEFYWHPVAKMNQMHLKPEGMDALVKQFLEEEQEKISVRI